MHFFTKLSRHPYSIHKNIRSTPTSLCNTSKILEDQGRLELPVWNTKLKVWSVRRYGNWSIFLAKPSSANFSTFRFAYLRCSICLQRVENTPFPIAHLSLSNRLRARPLLVIVGSTSSTRAEFQSVIRFAIIVAFLNSRHLLYPN